MSAQQASMLPFVWGSNGQQTTPEDLKRRRMLAEAMMAKGLDTSPVQHWTQGAARVAQALAGNIADSRITAEESAARKAADDRDASLVSGVLGGSAAPAASSGGALPAPPAPWASGDGGSKAFGEVAPRLSQDLQKDFGLAPHQAAGVVGNLAHESAGFGTMQEVKPMVPGSRGGFGYAQWTGPRRVAFENWSQQNGLDPKSYEANYGFLKHELTNTPEGRVLGAIKTAPDAQSATQLFSDQFLRPGIPGMGSRMKWTDRALGFAQQQPASPIPNTQPGMTQAQPLAEMPNAPVRMAAIGMNDASSPAQQMGLRPPMQQDAQPLAQAAAAQAMPQEAPQPTVAPRQQLAQAMQANPQAAQPQVNENRQRLLAAMQTMRDPYSSPGSKALAQIMIQKVAGQETKSPAQMEKEQLELAKLRNETGNFPVQRRLQEAQAAKAERELMGEGAQPLNEQERKAYGIPAEQAAYKTRTGEIKFGPAAAKTQVTLDNRQESEFGKETGKALAKRFDQLATDGDEAVQNLQLVDEMRKLGGRIDTGGSASIKAFLGKVGIKTDGISDIEAFNALIDRLTPQQRVPGSGATSDFDAKMFKGSLVGLMNTPEGNRMILDTMEKISMNKVARGDIAMRVQAGELSPKDGLAAIKKLQAEAKAISDQFRPAAKTDKPEGASVAPQAPAIGMVKGGYRFKGGNPADKNSWEQVR